MTAIATNHFMDIVDAEKAQEQMVCRVCGGDTKLRYYDDGFWVECIKHPGHQGLRDRSSEKEVQS